MVPASAAAQPSTDDLAETQAPATQEAPNDALELARRHYQRGVQFYKDGDDKLALVEFRRSYELSRNYRILFNIGRVNQQLNNYADAWIALSQYLREGGEDVPAERRLLVQAELDEMHSKTAQVMIVVKVADAQILVDGSPVGAAPLPAPIRVDVGDHYIEARRAGYRNAGRLVTLAGRDTVQVELQLIKNQPAALVSQTRAPTMPAEERSSALLWAGWIGTGALAAGAGVTGWLASSRAKDLDALRDSPTSTQQDRDAVAARAHSYALATDVLAAAAVVVGGASLYLTLSDGGPTREQPAPETRASLCGTGLCITHTY